MANPSKLSVRAQKFLARAKRWRPSHTASESTSLLKRAGLPAFDSVLQAEEHFGGLRYEVRGSTGMDLGLFRDRRRPNGAMAYGPAAYKLNGVWYFDFATQPSAPFDFRLCQSGTLYADTIPISSSIEKWIESEAVLDELVDIQQNWRWITFGQLARHNRQSLQIPELEPIGEASDAFTSWWASKEFRLVRATFWSYEQSADYYWGFATTPEVARSWAHLLTPLLKLPYNPSIHSWPQRREEVLPDWRPDER